VRVERRSKDGIDSLCTVSLVLVLDPLTHLELPRGFAVKGSVVNVENDDDSHGDQEIRLDDGE
jgi:hypothetical protein